MTKSTSPFAFTYSSKELLLTLNGFYFIVFKISFALVSNIDTNALILCDLITF